MSDKTNKTFLMAPKDLQDCPTYERVLEALKKEHPGGEVLADRDLFESNAHYRKSRKSVYGEARKVYLIAREDGTVGKGIFQQWEYLREKGVPMALNFEAGPRWRTLSKSSPSSASTRTVRRMRTIRDMLWSASKPTTPSLLR